MRKKVHSWRRGEGEDIPIGKSKEIKQPSSKEVASDINEQKIGKVAQKKSKADKMNLPQVPYIKDSTLRPDRSNQPREGEVFETEFLDNFAHQMVAPLQSIEMHCTNIIDGDVTGDESLMRLKEVVGHTRIIAELAQRMRFLHELISGKVISAEEMEFSKIVTTWIDGANNYLPHTRQRGVDVKIDLKMNRIPPVLASRLAAHQVIMNLYDNALKYGKELGNIQVRAHVNGEFVVNEFQHTAEIPITAESAPKVFDRGYRAKEAKALRASGSGVGMWISKKLMKAMQGDIKVYPTDSTETTKFVLYWRIKK